MPRKAKTLKLSTAVTLHGVTYSTIELREPSAKQFLDLGPITTNFAKNGVMATHDLEGVLSAYLVGGCATNVDPSVVDLLLADLPLVDGVRLRRTFASFFDDAIETVLTEEAAAAAAALVAAAPLAAAHEAVSAALGAAAAA